MSEKLLQGRARLLSLACTVLAVSTVSAACIFSPALPAFADAEQDQALGMTAYNARNYRVAAAYLQKAVNSGLSTKPLWMYLGHAYVGSGDRAHAVEAYAGLVSNFRGTPEAAQAMQYLQRLDPAAARKAAAGQPQPPVAAAPGAAPAAVPAVARAPYKERLTVIPPTLGHPAVSESMRAAVKAAMARIPAPLYKILDDGGAQVFLAPNIEDRWPGSGDGDKPNQAGVTMGEEPGRTYGHDSYVYEREKLRGRSDLGEARQTRDIIHTFYHEAGHAVDDCSGLLSNDPGFKSQFQLDMNDLSSADQGTINYYLVPMECCAELVGSLMGGESDTTNTVRAAFPRTLRWLKARLKM